MENSAVKKASSPFGRKRLLVALLIGFTLCGAVLLARYLFYPPRPWMVQWQVMRYLKKESAAKNFQTEFAFPSKAEMNKPSKIPLRINHQAKGPKTGKTFEELSREYIALKTSYFVLEREIEAATTGIAGGKENLELYDRRLAALNVVTNNELAIKARAGIEDTRKIAQARIAAMEKKLLEQPQLKAKAAALEPIESDLWTMQRDWMSDPASTSSADISALTAARVKLSNDSRQQLRTAKTYGGIYRVIGHQLWVAQQLLSSANHEIRRVGLNIVLDALDATEDEALNNWLASKICEGFILPHMELADFSNRRSALSVQNLANRCTRIFEDEDQLNNAMRTYETVLAMTDDPYFKDWAHAQQGFLYEQMGDYKMAISSLKAIKGTNDFQWAMRRLPRLEQNLGYTR